MTTLHVGHLITMASYGSVDADIEQLRRKLKKLGSDKDVQGRSSGRLSSSSERTGRGNGNNTPNHHQQQQQQQQQRPQLRSSLDMFGHLSASTRNLGQRRSFVGAPRVLITDNSNKMTITSSDYFTSLKTGSPSHSPKGSPAEGAAARTMSMISADGSASVGGIFGDSEAEYSVNTSNEDDDESDRRGNKFVNTKYTDDSIDDDYDDDDPSLGRLQRHDANGISQFDLMHESFGILSHHEDTEEPLKTRTNSYDARKGSDDGLKLSTGPESTDDSVQTPRHGFLHTRRQESYRNIRTVSMQPQVAPHDYGGQQDDDNDDDGGGRSSSSGDSQEQKILREQHFLGAAQQRHSDRREEEEDGKVHASHDRQNIYPNTDTHQIAQRELSTPSIAKKEPSLSSSNRRHSSRYSRTLSTGKTRRSSYVNVMPLSIAPDGSAVIVDSSHGIGLPQKFVSALTDVDDQEYFEDDDYYDDDRFAAFELLCSPSFSQFALLEIQPQQLLLVENEYLFADEGPNHLDPFLLYQDLDFGDHFTPDSSRPIDPASVSAFCFPDGLRIRYLPKAGIAGATRLGWIGPAGDKCHILVFTNGGGMTDHGVAITIQWEMNMKKSERQILSKAIYNRRKRRKASRRIQQWWRDREQDRILKEALEISGFSGHSPVDLKAELSPSELMLVETTLKRSDDRNSVQRQPDDKVATGHVGRRQARKKGMHKTPPYQSADMTKVVELIRAAVLRSPSASLLHDEISKASIASDNSPEHEEESKGKRGFGLLKGMSVRNNTIFQMRSVFSARSMASAQSLSPPTRPRRVLVKQPNTRVVELARESYETMKENDRLGSICVVEKCYTLIGCQPDEHALLLGPLQQLINAERSEILEFRGASADSNVKKRPKEMTTSDVEEERRLESELKNRRHVIIKTMREKLRLTMRQALITYPRTQLEHINGRIHYFEALIPQIPDFETTRVPLPLPRIGKEWALAQFLLDVGPDSLVLCLKLMLLERSILILGDNLQHVSMYACALIELLKPFEWSNAFMPVLPRKMLDFVNCPVPFIAGVAVRNVREIEKDNRIVLAMSHGMSLLNLKTHTLQITTEKGISRLISLDPYLRDKLQTMSARLQFYVEQNPQSSLRNFDGFVRSGLSRRESLTLVSVCRVLEQHFSHFCADLAGNDKAWQRYGTVDVKTNEFVFNPEWFLNHIRADHAFHEAIVQTQLFSGYVHERRDDRIEMHEIMEGELGCFIADWVYEKWTARRRGRSGF
jgi:hypothetical protein